MSLEQDIATLVAATDKLTQSVDTRILEIDKRISQKEREVDEFLHQARQEFPLVPNSLSDTKYFNSIAADIPLGTPVELKNAHSYPWNSYLKDGAMGHGTVTKIKCSDIAEYGIPSDSAFQKALGDYINEEESYYGSDFNILLFDIEITTPSENLDEGQVVVLSQGNDTFTGWKRGEFITQASCWINVLECDEGMSFYPSDSRSATIKVDEKDKGKGWLYKHASRTGWGVTHRPLFSGIGKMKVAICLMYVGTGNHGNNFIWSDSVGFTYTHGGPKYIPAESDGFAFDYLEALADLGEDDGHTTQLKDKWITARKAEKKAAEPTPKNIET